MLEAEYSHAPDWDPAPHFTQKDPELPNGKSIVAYAPSSNEINRSIPSSEDPLDKTSSPDIAVSHALAVNRT